MNASQRYISKELTHFVGSKLTSSAEKYSLLLHILKTGWLTHPPHDLAVDGNISVNPTAKLSGNEMYSSQVVCFCDIPLQDLSIHIGKYSMFGISFDKNFIVRCGGTPMLYVPKQALVRTEDEQPTKAEYFDTEIREYHALLNDLMGNYSNFMRIFHLIRFFDFHIFNYVKFFDHTLPEQHPDNYYYEREWRVIGNVHFSLEDIVRVVLPREYGKQFRADLPSYYGQVTFVP